MYFGDVETVDPSMALVPTDETVESITVVGHKPVNYWPWIIIAAVVLAVLIYYATKDKR